MAVSIITLKTGDRIITELKEIFDGEGDDKKGICLMMEDPYILSLDGATPQYLLLKILQERVPEWFYHQIH